MLKEEMKRRITRAQEAIKEAGIDMLFLVGRENIIYFTGSTQLEGTALIIPCEGIPCAVTLWLDREYLKEAPNTPDIKIEGYVFPTQNLVSKAVSVMKNYGFKNPRIGFERYFVSFSVYDGLRNNFSEAGFVDAAELIYKLRAVKSPYEIEMIGRASEIVCRGMDAALKVIKPGITELEVAAEAEYVMMKEGSEGTPFRMQVVSGERTLLPHPHASRKKVQEGELVAIHLGAAWEGYCSKICRVVALGQISPEQQRTFQILKEAQESAIAALKPGAHSWEVDAAARETMARAGYEKDFLPVTGYGIGLRQSEFYPIIGKGRQEVLREGMAVSLLLPTIFQRDIGGARITDVIHIALDGPHILTAYARELFTV